MPRVDLVLSRLSSLQVLLNEAVKVVFPVSCVVLYLVATSGAYASSHNFFKMTAQDLNNAEMPHRRKFPQPDGTWTEREREKEMEAKAG